MISSTVHNNTLTDIATALTGSLAKNGETVVTGPIDFNGVKLILDVDADTSITADTDDQIDIELSGADDFRFVANIFRALSGSSIETNTINETTAASGVTIDSLLVKDGNAVPPNGNGVDFSATASAAGMTSELFDDYEEGTFTPTLWDTSESDSESQTYATQTGTYTKVGNMVFFNLKLTMTSIGTLNTGQAAAIGGFPFAISAGKMSACKVWCSNVALGAATYDFNTGLLDDASGTTKLKLYESSSAATGHIALTVGGVTAAGNIVASGFYPV